MPRRITIMLNDDLVPKLRKIQAEQIRRSEKSIDFSHVINDVLRKELKG